MRAAHAVSDESAWWPRWCSSLRKSGYSPVRAQWRVQYSWLMLEKLSIVRSTRAGMGIHRGQMPGAVLSTSRSATSSAPALGGDRRWFPVRDQPGVQGFQLGQAVWQNRPSAGPATFVSPTSSCRLHMATVSWFTCLPISWACARSRQTQTSSTSVTVPSPALNCVWAAVARWIAPWLGQINGDAATARPEIRRLLGTKGQVVDCLPRNTSVLYSARARPWRKLAIAAIFSTDWRTCTRRGAAKILNSSNHITHPDRVLRIVFALAAHSGARGDSADLRQQACAAHGAVRPMAGFVFCDGGPVGRVILQCCAVGFHEAQRRGPAAGVQAQRQRGQQTGLQAHDHSSLNARRRGRSAA